MNAYSGQVKRPCIILITGPMAAGKSTVAQAVAERLPQSVHLRGDLFRRMIVNGQVSMTADLSPEAIQQLQLRYQLAAEVARRYVDAGFTVVYQDIILGHALAEAIARFQGYLLFVIVLYPRAEIVAARDRARNKTGYHDATSVHTFDRILRTETPRFGYWLDTSDLTVAETVDAILSHIALATRTREGEG
jgi:predicted kinase